MIPTKNEREILSSGVIEGAEFGISIADSAHIMTILRDTLYTDKILAVLREYSANAWDANRMVGKGDVPIEVHLPTREDPILRIRDHGPGMSKDDVYNVYTQYGASTKRDGNVAVGMLGIGSKSGFAYSDAFNVTSWNGGMRSIYSAMLDPSDKGIISLVSEEACDASETGIMIEIPVKEQDISTFVDTARRLFKYFEPMPKCNVEIYVDTSISKYKNGIVYKNNDYWYDNSLIAVMGCIPYKVDPRQILTTIPPYLSTIKVALLFDIGEVSVNASREELKYTEATKKLITQKFTDLIDEYVADIVKRISDPKVSEWDKRLLCVEFSSFSDLVQDDISDMMEDSVRLTPHIPTVVVRQASTTTLPDGKQETIPELREQVFSITKGTKKDHHETLFVGKQYEDTKIVIKDIRKTLAHFKEINDRSYIIHCSRDLPPPVIRTYVDKMIKDAKISGIKVVMLSSLTYDPPERFGRGAVKNVKHAMKLFTYNRGNDHSKRDAYGQLRCATPSSCWDPIDHVPGPGDVYVLLENFRVDFELKHYYDAMLNEYITPLGLSMPTIYGYKVTKKDLDDNVKRVGTPFMTWRTKFFDDLSKSDDFREILEYEATRVLVRDYYDHDHEHTDALRKELGDDHDIVKLFEMSKMVRPKKYDVMKRVMSMGSSAKAIETIKKEMNNSGVMGAINAMLERYPLLNTVGSNLGNIVVPSYVKYWCDYFKMVDSTQKHFIDVNQKFYDTATSSQGEVA